MQLWLWVEDLGGVYVQTVRERRAIQEEGARAASYTFIFTSCPPPTQMGLIFTPPPPSLRLTYNVH